MIYTIDEVIQSLQDTFCGYTDGLEECDLYDWQSDNFPHLHCASGATRFVCWDNDWGIVLKINLSADYDNDYCAFEASNYEEAKAMGIEAILLPTKKVAKIGNGDFIYSQPRFSYELTSLPRDEHNRLEKLAKKVIVGKIYNRSLSHCYDRRRIHYLWYARAYQIYGKKFMKQFEKWTNQFKIGDLHNHNVGFLNGKPILLDYAGFYGNRGRNC